MVSLKFFLKMHETDHNCPFPGFFMHRPGNEECGLLFPFQKLIDEISVDSLTMFERLFLFVFLFFLLIWHAARTYGRRRGNTIVSHFWMYQFNMERTRAYLVYNLCGEGVKESGWVWPFWTLCVLVGVVDILTKET